VGGGGEEDAGKRPAFSLTNSLLSVLALRRLEFTWEAAFASLSLASSISSRLRLCFAISKKMSRRSRPKAMIPPTQDATTTVVLTPGRALEEEAVAAPPTIAFPLGLLLLLGVVPVLPSPPPPPPPPLPLVLEEEGGREAEKVREGISRGAYREG
jgi:hypothetical protein